MVEASVRLNFEHMMEIYKSGYTRIPVYDRDPQNIIGICYTKDLIVVDSGLLRSNQCSMLWAPILGHGCMLPELLAAQKACSHDGLCMASMLG